MILLGNCRRVDPSDRDSITEIYLGRHPHASTWAGFADFGWFRLEPAEVRLVAGFGKMTWISGGDYLRGAAEAA